MDFMVLLQLFLEFLSTCMANRRRSEVHADLRQPGFMAKAGFKIFASSKGYTREEINQAWETGLRCLPTSDTEAAEILDAAEAQARESNSSYRTYDQIQKDSGLIDPNSVAAVTRAVPVLLVALLLSLFAAPAYAADSMSFASMFTNAEAPAKCACGCQDTLDDHEARIARLEAIYESSNKAPTPAAPSTKPATVAPTARQEESVLYYYDYGNGGNCANGQCRQTWRPFSRVRSRR